MAKVFNCKDFGGVCNWKGRAETREELLKKIAKHGAVKHNMREMSETMLAKITAAIRDERQDFKNLKR
jgi:predicted small metal-binding protein